MNRRRVPIGERLLAAYIVVLGIFLVLPILIVIPSAFSNGSSLTFPPEGFSLRWFRAIGARWAFVEAFERSAIIAVVATVISLCVGTLTAVALQRRAFPGRGVLRGLFVTPLVFPAIVLAVAIALVLGPLGLLRTYTGLIAAHVLITLPYVIRTVGATLSEIDRSVEEAALTLSATPWSCFWRVTFPLLKPGLIAGGVFSLIISFDEFTISLFIVGAGMMTLPLEMYNYAEFTVDPTLAAISTILITLTAIAVFIVEKLVGFSRQFA